jgi:hypothetical protein
VVADLVLIALGIALVIIIVCLVLGVWLAGQSIRLLAIEGGR